MRVYVSGPISIGDKVANMMNAINAANRILNAGHAPLVPHLALYWNMVHPHSWRTWMDMDLAWVEVCDALVRLPGESDGSDEEESRAKELGIPVYYGVDAFLSATDS